MIMTMAQPQSPRQRRLLAIHPGVHDGAACAFDGYDLVAAVQQERLTRKKGDGGGIPQAAIDEVLAIAGWAPEEVDALATTRAAFPFRFFSDATEAEIAARAAKGKTLLQMADHLGKRGHMDADKVFHSDLLRTELGLRPDVPVHFANHHKSHALPCLFYTDWDDALLFTHDGGGDLVHGSVRIYKNGTLVCPYGDDAWS
ncbi:MAG: carbamoyltransferase N-terminal domain-containing protein, partial [Rhodospirillaceae bacterium]